MMSGQRHLVRYEALSSGIICAGSRLARLMVAVTIAACAASSAAKACVVGNGMAASCDEAAFNACLPGGMNFDGTVTFNCGAILLLSTSSIKTISQDTTIDGGNTITLSANLVRLFQVNSGVTLSLKDIRLFDGLAGSSFAQGGAILNRGTVHIDHVRFENNRATGSGSTIANLAQGGAIYSDTNAVLTINDSTFFNNGASTAGTGIGQAYGGALYNTSGVTATITNSTFDSNTVSVTGASNDVADYGGAIYSGATLTMTNSTLINNTVSGANARGSGIFESSGTATLTNDTIRAAGGPASSLHNFSSTFTLTNTIVAGAPQNCVAEMAAFTDGGHNIDDGSSCPFTGTSCGNPMGTSFCSTNPGLDPAGLGINGGPTRTIALCTDAGMPAGCGGASPAIDAGDETVCSNTMGTAPVNSVDQRGSTRPGGPGPNCDIGAFEAQVIPPTDTPASTPTATSTSTPTSTSSGTPTHTATNSATPTNTATLTNSATATNTATSTATATGTATSTPNSTPTNTATPQPNGADCSSGSQCLSTFCVDGVCCNTACDGPLAQCNLPGEAGVCASTAAPAPTLSPWGLMIGVLLLAGIAAVTLRRGTSKGV